MAPAFASSAAMRRPSSAGREASPVPRRTMRRRPSGEITIACMASASPSKTAIAPSGSWQPPPSAATTARSAVNAANAAGSLRASTAARVPSASARVSIATIPWPGAGIQSSCDSSSEIRPPRPSRLRPAAASTRASYSPSSTLRRRVSTLPRTGRNRARGNRAVSCAERRTLLVPIAGSSPSAVRPCLKTSASRESSRGSTAATPRPSGSVTDMSLALCTARSMVRASRASSISFTKSPLPPDCESTASCSRSPSVLMVTSSVGWPRASRSAATVRACQSASALPRVPIRRGSVTLSPCPPSVAAARAPRVPCLPPPG